MVHFQCMRCGQVWFDGKPLKVIIYGVCPGPIERFHTLSHLGPICEISHRNIRYQPVSLWRSNGIRSFISPNLISYSDWLLETVFLPFHQTTSRTHQAWRTFRRRNPTNLSRIVASFLSKFSVGVVLSVIFLCFEQFFSVTKMQWSRLHDFCF